ncbi:hypothetical protein K3495_g13985, partial [Podosphaera aphanis]
MSYTTVSFKDIRSGLPTLMGQSNFRRWYNTWYVSLRGANLWSVVCDGDKKESRPCTIEGKDIANLDALQQNYDKRNDAAHALLVSGVCEELQDLVSSVADELESARVAMRLLKTKFDHETTTSTLNLFTSFLDLKMDEGDDLSTYLSNFDTAFQHISSRCTQSKRPEAKALKEFLSVEQVRIMCLFRSLPRSMDNVIDNLSTKIDLTYPDVSAHLADLWTQKTLSTHRSPSTAYFTAKDARKGQNTKECSWCKKRGYYFTGHSHRECRKLKAQHQQKDHTGSANVAAAPERTSEEDYDNDIAVSEKAFVTSLHQFPAHWILDSGCSTHMTSRKDLFSSIVSKKGTVTVASGMEIPVLGCGNIDLDLLTSSGKQIAATLENVLYVPGLKGGNLVSESKLERSGFEIASKNGKRRVLENGKEWMFAVLDDMGHFVVKELKNTASFTSYMDAHSCFGHPGENAMLHLIRRYPDLIPIKPEQFHSEHKNPSILSTPISPVNSQLILSYGVTIKKFFSDNGGEYIDKRVENLMDEFGIVLLKSPAYEHESNGIAERFNRTIVTKARAMLLNFPKFLWAESIATAVYLYNRTPHRTIDYRSPLELLDNTSPPAVSHLHSFGCKVFVHIPVESRPSGSKLQPRATEGYFVGYTDSCKIFRIYIPSKRSVQVTRQVLFPTTKTGEITIDLTPPPKLDISTGQASFPASKPGEVTFDLPNPPSPGSLPSQASFPTSKPGEVRQVNSRDQVSIPSISVSPSSPREIPNRPQTPEDYCLPGTFTETPEPILYPNSLFNPLPQTPSTQFGLPTPGAPRRKRQAYNQELGVIRKSSRERRQADPGPGMVPNTQRYQANAVTVEPTTYQQAIQSNDSELWKFAIEEEMDALKRNKT